MKKTGFERLEGAKVTNAKVIFDRRPRSAQKANEELEKMGTIGEEIIKVTEETDLQIGGGMKNIQSRKKSK
ncbi:MAG: hypothetical protein HN981_03425 [Candidatus Pacebacteria bacterium]|jgi:hypothetical protein|nr:hypothetical protein [Candidatus Paceibacterota bacterium]MBT4651953.1 hypothetical protein [Candidatus Paceibacterota bacterium]MBT6755975.1 hypothetical protein [Candidatus Paceibacterota bacterium]MBT6921413.1 hypothetical protein [Candidatus Paceibacterota bacterium]